MPNLDPDPYCQTCIHNRETFRRQIAADVLLRFLGNGGRSIDKVRAAVRYADMLLAELDNPTDANKDPEATMVDYVEAGNR
jgi:hypothetical protein